MNLAGIAYEYNNSARNWAEKMARGQRATGCARHSYTEWEQWLVNLRSQLEEWATRSMWSEAASNLASAIAEAIIAVRDRAARRKAVAEYRIARPLPDVWQQ